MLHRVWAESYYPIHITDNDKMKKVEMHEWQNDEA